MKKNAKLLLCIVLFIICFTTGCTQQQPFRLHVIANSDSELDQSTKLAVRDAILNQINEDMKNIQTKEQAEEYILENLEILEKVAEDTIQSRGLTYGAQAMVGRYEFPEKTYGDKVYPAGEYDALRIVLGEGKGKNWWCVLFPPLCLMEIEDAQKAEELEQQPEFTSFFGELFQNIFH